MKKTVKNSTYGQGTIGCEKVGKYEYWTFQFYDNSGKKQKKRFPHTREGLKNAKEFQKEVSRKKTDGVLVSCNHTVSSWIEEYIQTYKINSLRDSSLSILLLTFNKIEVSPIADIPLDKLTGNQVQNFYNALADKWTDKNGKLHEAIASSSIGKVHKLLSAAFKKAVQLRMIALNPMDTIDAPKVRYAEKGIFTDKELQQIFDAVTEIASNKCNTRQSHDYNLLFTMLLQCGMRVGELLALQWQDVNFQKREIHVHATKVRCKQEFNSTKTMAGNRYIPIINDNLLASLKEYQNRNGIIRPVGYIFEDANGNAMEYRNISRYWTHIRKLTGIEKNIHCFRHTCATLWLEKGIPVAEVSRILGHSDPTITYSMYTHSIPGYNQKIIEQFRQAK